MAVEVDVIAIGFCRVQGCSYKRAFLPGSQQLLTGAGPSGSIGYRQCDDASGSGLAERKTRLRVAFLMAQLSKVLLRYFRGK